MALFRNLGPFSTTAIGHGEMPLTIENNRGHEVGIETLHASLDAGCRHIDTAWAYYCSGGEEQTGEKLVREALETWKGPKDEVLVATKVGHFRNFTDGRPTWDVDGRPENLIRRGKESALALGVDTIDLLYFHRPDPKVPYNESVEAIKQLVDEGVALNSRTQDSRAAVRGAKRCFFIEASQSVIGTIPVYTVIIQITERPVNSLRKFGDIPERVIG